MQEYLRTHSLQDVANAFAERFPNRAPPAKSTIWKNVRKYLQEGTSLNLNQGRSGRPRTARTPQNIEAVRQQLEANPANLSGRRNGLGLTQTAFRRIVRLDLGWYPYKMNVRHQLLPADGPRRMQFCQWFLRQNDQFLRHLVIGDESAFFMNGKVCTQNVREYAPFHQPPDFHYDANMSREKVSLWIGLCGNGNILGPFFFEGNMNGDRYLDMINDQIVPELEAIFQRQRRGVFRRLWWVHDGAPAHQRVTVRDRLRELFADRVIALHHEIEWPPRSPDLTPCDFFLFGYLKNEVFKTPPQNVADLRDRITRAVDALRGTEGVVNAFRDMRRRAELCVQQDGRHVEGHGR